MPIHAKHPILLVTHVLALGIAYGVARNTPPQLTDAAPQRTKSAARGTQSQAGDGAQLLADFLQAEPPGSAGDAIRRNPPVDLDQRLEVMRNDPDLAGRSRQELVDKLVVAEVTHLLKEGRDWKFEFRHGAASLDEVLTAVRAALPGISTEGEAAMRETLYRQLAGENSQQARLLLATLPEEKQREILFHFSKWGLGKAAPEEFFRFLADLPEPRTPEEQETRRQTVIQKSRCYLSLFGDDYVDWVRDMPAGPVRDEAARNVIPWIRTTNPTKALELEKQLSPEKP